MFHTYVASVLSGCCVCFAMVSSVFYKCFILLLCVAMVIHACFKCFIYFRRTLQVFYLDVSKVDIGKAHAAVVSAPPWVTA